MATLPFWSSLVLIERCSAGSVGYHSRGSQLYSPGSVSSLRRDRRFRFLVSERGSHLLTMVHPSMNAQRRIKISPNSGNSASRRSRWRIAGPSMPMGFFRISWVKRPTAASTFKACRCGVCVCVCVYVCSCCVSLSSQSDKQ